MCICQDKEVFWGDERCGCGNCFFTWHFSGEWQVLEINYNSQQLITNGRGYHFSPNKASFANTLTHNACLDHSPILDLVILGSSGPNKPTRGSFDIYTDAPLYWSVDYFQDQNFHCRSCEWYWGARSRNQYLCIGASWLSSPTQRFVHRLLLFLVWEWSNTMLGCCQAEDAIKTAF